MKSVSEIIEAYREAGHKVDGLFLREVMWEGQERQLEILLCANGRDIIVKEPEEWIYDGQDFEYSGKENPNFARELYL